MDPLILMIEPELDERAATATMARAQRVYEEGARDISRVMRQQLTEGTEAAGRGFEDLETRARKAYLGMQDAADKVAREQRKLDAAVERGAQNTEALARRVERARMGEIEAIERASAAYREYEQAANGAGRAGGENFLSGLNGAMSGVRQAGGDMANGFVGGFAGSSALMRLGAAGGPIGLGLAGVAALGYMSGKVLADNIAAGLASMQMRDLFQARLGVDDATMAQYGRSASAAWVDGWGASTQDNLRALQFSVQGGVIDPGASDEAIQSTITQMQTLATVMEVDVQQAARATGQLIRGGFADDATEAADIIVSGFQGGLDIAGDWLDTVTEYTTQFRKLGLDGGDALGLIQQGLQGAARDSDVVADSLKEFAIRAVDGSESTAEGFASLGFNADEMAQRFLAGGDSARQALGATLQAIKNLQDPQQQALAWVALFGTQWQDMGDAVNKFDLSKARTEFGSTEGAIDSMTDKLSEHANQWDTLGRHIDQTFMNLKEWLADSAIGEFFSQGLPSTITTVLFGDDNIPTNQVPMGPPSQPVQGPGLPSLPAGPSLGGGLGDLLNPPTAPPGGSGLPPILGGSGPSIGSPLGPKEFYEQLYPKLPGTVPDSGPVPGERTPILTELQQQAADDATKGAGGASLPPAPVLPMQYTSMVGLPTGIANAQTRLDETRHDVAEKTARVEQLEQSNVATAVDIQKARNDLIKAQQDQLQAERALNDARVNATRASADQMDGLARDLGQIGAQLDDDFGVSKGLAGIAENITRFLANLAMAPVIGALTGVQAAAGYGPGEAGTGLTGVMAGAGMFGPQFQVLPQWARSQQGGASASQMGPAALQPGMGGYPGDAALLANVPAGRYTQEARGDLTQGLADCSSAVEDLVNLMDGRPTGGASMWTGNAAEWLTSRGFLPGAGGPGDFRVGFNDSHMQATLPGGTPFNWGSQAAASNRGIGGTGAFDPAFTSHYYRPATSSSLSSTGPSLAPSMPAPGYSTPGLYSAANTDPGLTGPGASPGWMGPGVPGGVSGGGGQSPVFGAGGPGGLGSSLGVTPGGPGRGWFPGAGGQAAPSQSVGGGRAYGQGLPASSGIGFGGGLIGLAQSLPGQAAGAAGGMFPGGGAAGAAVGAVAQLGIDQINRAVGAAGQYAGALAGGVLETFSLNGSALADPGRSWLGRLGIAAAGARPALPNTAGALGGAQNENMAEGGMQPPPPLSPQQAEQARADAGRGAGAVNGAKDGRSGDTYEINVTNQRAREDGTGRDIQSALRAQNTARQPR